MSDDPLQCCLDQAVAVSHARQGVIGTIHGGTFEVLRGCGMQPEEWQSRGINGSIVYKVLHDGTPHQGHNAYTDARYHRGTDLYRGGLRQVLAVPIARGEQRVAVLYVDRPVQDGVWQPGQLDRLQALVAELEAQGWV
ncbi:MAG: GAF domain-containing protein [Candidatus Xenobia bacterium]